jgi:nucleoside-diphosphate-sugar epimerase
MNTYLIGGNGRLGRAIAERYADTQPSSLQRSVYEPWAKPGAADVIARYFERHAGDATVFVASGLLDPRLPKDELLGVNYWLPRNIVDGAGRQGIKVVTFGTVMEALIDSSNNPYVASKKALCEYIGEVASANVPALHFQIHTLYGAGLPSPSMFLGQIFAAIEKNEPFRMTSGQQLREYHHFDDEALAIRKIVSSRSFGVTDLSHGKPTPLKAIAEAVFASVGKRHLLEVGALPDPVSDNYDKVFPLTPRLETIEFRNAIQGTVEYMKQCFASTDTTRGTGILS